MSDKVLIDRDLLAKATMLPSMRSLEENRRDIVERGRAQADIREMLAAAPAAPVARAEQEPVATVVERKEGSRTWFEGVIHATAIVMEQIKDGDPLYAAPPAHPDAALAEALEELVLLVEDIRQGEYIPDSFTTQPARIALAAYRKGAAQ